VAEVQKLKDAGSFILHMLLAGSAEVAMITRFLELDFAISDVGKENASACSDIDDTIATRICLIVSGPEAAVAQPAAKDALWECLPTTDDEGGAFVRREGFQHTGIHCTIFSVCGPSHYRSELPLLWILVYFRCLPTPVSSGKWALPVAPACRTSGQARFLLFRALVTCRSHVSIVALAGILVSCSTPT